MLINRKTSFANRHQGVAMVEFAIILPFIILMVYSILEVSRLQLTSNTLAKSVRDGARYLASNAEIGDTGLVNITSAVEATTKNLVVYGLPNNTGTPTIEGISTDNVQVIDLGDNIHVRVTATYNYTPILGGSIPTLGLLDNPINLTIPISASVSMRSL